MQSAKNSEKGTVFSIEFTGWEKSVPPLLDRSALPEHLVGKTQILIKPNLVESLQPPITTPVGIIKVLVDYLTQKAPHCEIIIGEGCGSLEYDTWRVFDDLGYTDLSREANVSLVDLNEEKCLCLKNSDCKRFPSIYLPEILFDSFLLSVPVLKAHSLAGVTLTMKNMMGAAPPRHYQQGGHWKKASFHTGVHEAVYDLNRYRAADFTLLDATIGMAEAHLWGPTCSPPVNKLAAGFDPVALDAYGCHLLGKRWSNIAHLRYADGILGSAEYKEIRCTP
ncbi:MAG: DUF362 domain-containing protein [Desulfobulbaceae bacterium]|nr:DUF362 domain-containing protein [Desulfobulbaceae bacterium]